MPAGHIAPPVWDAETLKRDLLKGIADFVRDRTAEGGARYRAAFAKNLADVESLFEATNDLREFATGVALAARPPLSHVARYLCGPPISADDLNTIAGTTLASRKRLDEELALRTATVIRQALDPERFPWLFEDPPNNPTPAEREIALRWTAGLKAAQEVQTGRRGESAKRQQARVRDLLAGLGFVPVRRREVNSVRDVDPGEFLAQETRVRTLNCDVPICLRDGRLLLIECKVSNSAVNSYKRLNHECGNKASTWRSAFGDEAITAAVLSGVFSLQNLLDAQAARNPVVIFWEHDLTPLADFIEAAGP